MEITYEILFVRFGNPIWIYFERPVLTYCIFYRTIVREHIPKKHLDFENAIHTDKVFDNTKNRINGETRD